MQLLGLQCSAPLLLLERRVLLLLRLLLQRHAVQARVAMLGGGGARCEVELAFGGVGRRVLAEVSQPKLVKGSTYTSECRRGTCHEVPFHGAIS